MATLSHTPWWVFPLFAYLLVIGLKSLKTREMSVWKLALAPTIFAVWGVIGMLRVIGSQPVGWLMFGGSLLAGGLLGWWLGRLVQVRALHGKRIMLHGSPVTLILILVIFSCKYALGYWQATDPQAMRSMAFLLVDAGVTGAVIGMFLGRFLGILWRVRCSGAG